MANDTIEYRPEVYEPSLLNTWLQIAKRQAGKDRIVWAALAKHLIAGKVLELGAGVGQISALLIEFGHTVVCSDYAEFFVDHMKSIGLDAHRIDATDIKSAGLGQFPNIVCQSITPFITTDYSVVERAYQSAYETLLPGGRLVLIHAMVKDYKKLPRVMGEHDAVCRKVGFKDVQVFRNQLLPAAAYRAPISLAAKPLEYALGKRWGIRFVVVASKPRG